MIVWILSAWFAIFLLGGFITNKPYLRIIFLNIAIFSLSLGVLEIYFWKTEAPKLTTRKSSVSLRATVPAKTDKPPLWENREGNYIRKDDVLGYAPIKNSQGTVTKYFNDEFLYKATYTIDNNGLRISPNANRFDSPSILFFGCSYTFCEGVNDEETMPYLTGKLTDGEFAVYNFGFHGYGPQHMLAQIEHGLVDTIITRKPRYAIYLAITGHVERTKGLDEWLKDSPLYILDDKGEVVSTTRNKISNNIEAKISALSRINEWFKESSYLYRALNKRTSVFKQNLIENDDIKTYVGVVTKSMNLLNSKYPGIEFHVIFIGDDRTAYNEAIIEALRKKRIKVHEIEDVTRDYIEDTKKFLLIPHDWHPTALYHRMIAEYIVHDIIGGQTKVQ
jgi:hypothetical protein